MRGCCRSPLTPTPTLTPTLTKKLARLLQVADENIGAALKKYELDQELGETINELSEIYFSKYPRSFDAPWPSPDHLQHDMQLRALFEGLKARAAPLSPRALLLLSSTFESSLVWASLQIRHAAAFPIRRPL